MATIGTAYVQIAPSTQGISSALNSVFSKEGVKGGQTLGKGTGSSFAKSGFAGAVAGVFATAVSKGLDTISNSLGNAVARYDTITNFPNVMKNFGISADDASRAIDKLSDGLNGLPTPLDTAVGAVQRFTSKTGDVGEATDLFLAFNNAVLAGGQPLEIQATALEQYSQAFAKGKPDMIEWRALLSAMPAQLSQIAQYLDYGSNGVEKLGSDLRDGSLSVEDFNQALLDLNEKGVKGFPSFAEQAKLSANTIQVAWANLGTAVTRGLANIIGAIDSALTDNNLGTIGSSINSFATVINGAFKIASTATYTFVDALASVGKAVSGTFSGLEASLNPLKDAFADVQTTISHFFEFLKITSNNSVASTIGIFTKEFETTLGEFNAKLFTYVNNILRNFGELATGFIDRIPDVLASITYIGNQLTIGFVNAFNLLLPVLTTTFTDIISSLITNFVSTWEQMAPILIEAVPTLFEALVTGLSENVPLLIEGISQLGVQIGEAFTNTFGQLTEYLNEGGANIIFEILESIGLAIIEAIPFLIENATNIITFLIDGLSQAIETYLPLLIETFVTLATELATALLNGIVENLPQIIESIVGLVDTIVTTLTENVPQLIEGAKQLLLGIVEAIPQIIPPLIEALPDIISSIAEFLTESIDLILEAGIELFNALIEALPYIIEALVTALPEIIETVVNFLLQNFDRILEAGEQLFLAIVKAIPLILAGLAKGIINLVKQAGKDLIGKAKDLKNDAKELWDNIVQAIADIIPDIVQKGKDILNGLWEGIKEKKDWLIGKVKGIGKSIADGFGSVFKFGSPSKLTWQYGAWFDEGFANGVTDYAKVAIRAVQDLADDIVKVFDTVEPDFFDTTLDYVNSGFDKFDDGIRTVEYKQVIVNQTVENRDTLLDNYNNIKRAVRTGVETV